MKHRLVSIVLCLVFSILSADIDYAAGLQAGLTLVYVIIAPTIDTVTCAEIVGVQFLFAVGFLLESDWYWQQLYFKLMLALFFLTETYEIVEIVPTPFYLWAETRLAGAASHRWGEKFRSLPS